ncbi:MAG: hypothetical protein ABI120_08410, partial [Gemmatimonadaceae bacterium]
TAIFARSTTSKPRGARLEFFRKMERVMPMTAIVESDGHQECGQRAQRHSLFLVQHVDVLDNANAVAPAVAAMARRSHPRFVAISGVEWVHVAYEPPNDARATLAAPPSMRIVRQLPSRPYRS